ncbi:MAG: TonB-dependent receptor [Gammaproteobacteria bacterium]|nr:TonB-dependent receptor [Gammaproteobacteria bacterium]
MTSFSGLKSTPVFRRTLLSAVIATTFTQFALAQETQVQQSEPDADLEVIEVRGAATGTLIRGATPVGTNVVGLSEDDVAEIGVPDSNELLAQIPQMTSTFNSRPTMATDIGQGMPMPKLRDIGTGGGNTTLVLLNGLRLPGSGIIQTVPNAAAIPPSVLSTVEIVMDGGSSIYGSDAIAGVVNFITQRPKDGVVVNLEGGFGDSYNAGTLNLTAGTSWNSGAAMLSFYHAQNSDVLGADRDFITADNTANGGGDYRTRQCDPGNITVAGTSFRMDTMAPGSNLCDPNDGVSYVPQQKQDTIFLSLEQDFSDNVFLNLNTYYSEWGVDITGDATNAVTDLGASGTITSSNPYFSAIGDETSQTVDFNFSDVVGPGAKNKSEFKAFSFMPELTVELPNYWRLKAAYSYGWADTHGEETGVNASAVAAALAGTQTSTALNPYDVASTNSAVLNNILSYYGTFGDAKQTHHQVRLTLDGAILSLPAGDVMLAVGAEYFKQNYDVSFGGGPSDALQMSETSASRNVKSVFSEVIVPVLDDVDAGTIDFTASIRHDSYNDVGSTTNPKVGVDYSPTENLRLRAQWGTSFQAPSLADSGAAVDTRAITLPVSPFLSQDAADADFLRGTIILAGGSEGLKPEESESYSVGFDWTPEFSEGLKVSMTYFDVDYSSAISLAPFYTPSVLFNTEGYADYYTINPTLEQALSATDGMRIDGLPIESLYADGNSVYALFDARRNNMTATKLSGIDFDIAKKWQTSFGSVNASIAGSYTLDRTFQPVQGAEYQDEKSNDERGDYNLLAQVGATSGNMVGSVRVLYTDGWENAFASADSLTTVNLFGKYDLGEFDFVDEASITINIDNLFDEEAVYFDDVNGFISGSTLGRVVYLGINFKM